MDAFFSRAGLRRSLNDLLLLDNLGVPAEQVNLALNRAQMRTLPFMYFSIASFYFAYILIQLFILREPGLGLMVAVALVSAVFLLVMGWLIRNGRFSSKRSERLAAIIAFTVLVSIQLRFYLTGEPQQVANLALFVFGTAVLFFDTRWYLLMSGLAFAGLIHALLLFAGPEDWRYNVVVFLAATAVGLVAHVSRVRAYRRTEILRIREQRQRQQLERRNLQLRTNMAAGRQITSILDLDTLLQHIASMVWEKYRIYYVGVFLPTGDGQTLHAAAEAGRAVTHEPLKLTAGANGHVGWVMAYGESLNLKSMADENGRFIPTEKAPQTLSELLLPLEMGERVLGVLDLQSSRPAHFLQEEIPVFQLLADQMAVALENARLYAEVTQFNQQLEGMVIERTNELQTAYSHLEKLDRTKSDFITIASHEMLTPLTIITLNAQMFMEEEEIQTDHLYRSWVEGIDKGVTRMREVVETMLDIAKIDSESLTLHKAELDLHFFLQQIIKRFQFSLTERRLSLTLAPMPLLPKVAIDSEAMEKVFYHLIINAIKFTPDGGKIVINGRSTQLAVNGATVPAVEIVVADTGVGVAPELQDLIFEKFYQTGEVMLHSSGKTKFKGGGSGLGLSIARGIVVAHNGRIWVESPEYNEELYPGSQFHVVLPVH
ncbi:MAG: GAF domain-containing sensor histidine kinase [Anaerolineae bacterium]|nr:GAF domain-containing sensor histidine kinase [Anaerolineae bacterium]